MRDVRRWTPKSLHKVLTDQAFDTATKLMQEKGYVPHQDIIEELRRLSELPPPPDEDD